MRSESTRSEKEASLRTSRRVPRQVVRGCLIDKPVQCEGAIVGERLAGEYTVVVSVVVKQCFVKHRVPHVILGTVDATDCAGCCIGRLKDMSTSASVFFTPDGKFYPSQGDDVVSVDIGYITITIAKESTLDKPSQNLLDTQCWAAHISIDYEYGFSQRPKEILELADNPGIVAKDLAWRPRPYIFRICFVLHN